MPLRLWQNKLRRIQLVRGMRLEVWELMGQSSFSAGRGKDLLSRWMGGYFADLSVGESIFFLVEYNRIIPHSRLSIERNQR